MIRCGPCCPSTRSGWLAAFALCSSLACNSPDPADSQGADDVGLAVDAHAADGSTAGDDADKDADAGSRGRQEDAATPLPDAATGDHAVGDAPASDGGADAVGPGSACTPTSATAVGPKAGGGLEVLLATTRADATGFEPLTKGCALPLIYGIQGTFHLWATVCVPDSVQGAFALTFSLRDIASGAPLPLQFNVLKTPATDKLSAPGYRCRSAIPIMVHCGCQLAGKPVSLHIDVAMIDPKAPKVMPTNPALLGWAEVDVTPTYISGLCPSDDCP